MTPEIICGISLAEAIKIGTDTRPSYKFIVHHRTSNTLLFFMETQNIECFSYDQLHKILTIWPPKGRYWCYDQRTFNTNYRVINLEDLLCASPTTT